MLGVVDCNDNYNRVGAAFADMEQKLALKQQVRRLERRVCLPQQRDIMYQALKIAVVLSELNLASALSSNSSPINFVRPSWNVIPAVAIFCLLLCSMLLQGCKVDAMLKACAELWF